LDTKARLLQENWQLVSCGSRRFFVYRWITADHASFQPSWRTATPNGFGTDAELPSIGRSDDCVLSVMVPDNSDYLAPGIQPYKNYLQAI
jgi:hypothetical protein